MVRRIFISSTQRELAKERRAVVDLIARHVRVTVKRPVFNEAGERVAEVGPKTEEVTPKTEEVGPKAVEVGPKNRQEPITKTTEPITKTTEPITKTRKPITKIPVDFDIRMAANRKDLRDRAKLIWMQMALNPRVTIREIAEEFHFGIASIQGAVNAMKECGLLVKVGSTKGSRWEVSATNQPLGGSVP